MTFNAEQSKTKMPCAGCPLGLCVKARKLRPQAEGDSGSLSDENVGVRKIPASESVIEQSRFSPMKMAKAE